MVKIIAVANQKGGVGKTTTATNLSAALAGLGKKTLIIDFDPQGNTTSGFGFLKDERLQTLYPCLIHGTNPKPYVLTTGVEDLYLLPADIQLSGAEVDLASLDKYEYRLKRLVQHFGEEYAYVIIDCPPSLSLLTINALCVANSVIIPLQCEFYALEGMSLLLKTIQLIKKKYNQNLQIEGILATMYDQRNNIARQVLEELSKHFASYIFKTLIPRNVHLSEAPSHGMPVIIFAPNSIGAKAYFDLAKEVIEQEV